MIKGVSGCAAPTCTLQSNTINANVDSTACANVVTSQSCSLSCKPGYTGNGQATFTCPAEGGVGLDVSGFTCTRMYSN